MRRWCSWPAWADVVIKDGLVLNLLAVLVQKQTLTQKAVLQLQLIVETVKLGSYTTAGGYRHLWQPCLALSELASRERNRRYSLHLMYLVQKHKC